MPRPYVGPQVLIRMPQYLIDALDAAAADAGISRPEMARLMVTEGLDRRVRAARRAASRS